MTDLLARVDQIAAVARFSGVVRVDLNGQLVLAKGYGMADRAHGLANLVDGQFNVASGGKGLTALTVVSLIQQGHLELATTARSLLGPDLPLIADDVTVEQLLAHRSGIGDYLNEEEVADINDYVMRVPVHKLAEPEQFLPVLDGHLAKSAPNERFSY